jgi:hypothetical protein
MPSLKRFRRCAEGRLGRRTVPLGLARGVPRGQREFQRSRRFSSLLPERAWQRPTSPDAASVRALAPRGRAAELSIRGAAWMGPRQPGHGSRAPLGDATRLSWEGMPMTDPLRGRRRDEIPVPDDLWDEVRRRSRPLPSGEAGSRRLLGTVAVLLLVAGGVALAA